MLRIALGYERHAAYPQLAARAQTELQPAHQQAAGGVCHEAALCAWLVGPAVYRRRQKGLMILDLYAGDKRAAQHAVMMSRRFHRHRVQQTTTADRPRLR